MKASLRLIALAVLVALVQIGFLGWMIAGRAGILRDGAEIRLKVEPVDPRDLLRGDYVRLAYDISAIPVQLRTGSTGRSVDRGDRMCVGLEPNPDGLWQPVSLRAVDDRNGAPVGTVEICGKVTSVANGRDVRLEYGIERFYLPEGQGRAIERDMRVRTFIVVAAVDADGQAQIKALYDGKNKLYEEPLY